jgi:hypothetical protein
VAATQALLAALPALAPRWQRLREALLALRGPAQDEAEAAWCRRRCATGGRVRAASCRKT